MNQSESRRENWFVVSDHPPYKQYIKSNAPVDRINVSMLDLPTDPGLCSNVQHALIELWLLSECREILMTEWSSFGWLAASRKGIHPIIVSKTSCHRQLVSRPCYYELRHLQQLSCYNYESMLKEDGCCRNEGFCGNQCLHHENTYHRHSFYFLLIWPFAALAKWFIQWVLILSIAIVLINRLTVKTPLRSVLHWCKYGALGILVICIVYVDIRCLLWKMIKVI